MYDNTSKLLINQFCKDFTEWLIGEPIELNEMQPTELYYEPIRADGVVLLKNDNLICHWEFQTNPDKYMAYRMLDYYVRLLGLYPDCQILQTVIYLRETTSELVSCDFYQDAHTTHQFRVMRIWEEEAETLMNLPGLLPYAVLGKTNNREKLLRQVAQKIEQIPDAQQRSNLTAGAAIFAGLKLDQQLINQIFRRDFMQGSVIYDQIFQEGEAIGEARGEAIGERAMMMKMLNRRLGLDGSSKTLPISLQSQIESLSLSKINSLAEVLLDFSDLADLEEWLSRH
jgi:predicted transposase/invertase (TIGR01784 family)